MTGSVKGYEVLKLLTDNSSVGWAVILLILFLTLVQVAPININPWDSIFKWFGKKMNGEMEKRLSAVEKQISDMWINQHRQAILLFSREEKDNIKHSSEEWVNVLNVAKEYEDYIKANDVPNGIVTENTRFIRNLYQEMNMEKIRQHNQTAQQAATTQSA